MTTNLNEFICVIKMLIKRKISPVNFQQLREKKNK